MFFSEHKLSLVTSAAHNKLTVDQQNQNTGDVKKGGNQYTGMSKHDGWGGTMAIPLSTWQIQAIVKARQNPEIHRGFSTWM